MVQPEEIPTTSTTNGNNPPTNDRTSIIFTLKNQVGGLARALQVFQELGINVLHVEFHSTVNETEMVKFN